MLSRHFSESPWRGGNHSFPILPREELSAQPQPLPQNACRVFFIDLTPRLFDTAMAYPSLSVIFRRAKLFVPQPPPSTPTFPPPSTSTSNRSPNYNSST